MRFADLSNSHSIHVLAGDYKTSQPALKAFDEYLSSPSSFINTHRPVGGADSSIVHSKKEHRHIEKEILSNDRNPFFVRQTYF